MGMLRYGPDTVTFLSRTATGPIDDSGTQMLSEAGVSVVGCLHQPVPATGRERVGREFPEPGVSVATQWWKTTAPPHPAALAAQASDVLLVNGNRYEVLLAPQPVRDGVKVVKVTILSELQTTGY